MVAWIGLCIDKLEFVLTCVGRGRESETETDTERE